MKTSKLIALVLVIFILTSFAACAPKAVGGQNLDATLFTLGYEAGEWSYDTEEFKVEDDYAYVCMNSNSKDSDGDPVTTVEISVEIDSAWDFREDLAYYGFDHYEYAVNKSYTLVKVGGVDCAEYKTDDEIIYLGRVENAGATVNVEVGGEISSESVKALIDGIKFNLKDAGNTDIPWAWDGTPFSAETKNSGAGAVSITSQFVKNEECITTYETFDHDIAVVGDKAYILVDGVLKQYAYNGTTLKFEKDLEDFEGFDLVTATSDGTLWLSGSGLTTVKNGAVAFEYEDAYKVAMHPSGTWGIDWFTGPECKKLAISGTTVNATEINFKEVDTISNINVDKDYIFVCGYAADDSGHKVFVYDANGTLKYTLCDEEGEGLGSITFAAQTATGFAALDGNMRTLVTWDANGAFAGEYEDSELFSTSYPWFCSGHKLDDNSFIAVMTEKRADESAMELVAFKVTISN